MGTWDVQDVVGTQTIGSTKVSFKPQGELSLKPPMQGLRWRLDPGPTHLDTCTFQVLSDDGAILQYTVGPPPDLSNSSCLACCSPRCLI